MKKKVRFQTGNAGKNRDTALLFLSLVFLAGGAAGYVLEAMIPAGEYVSQLLLARQGNGVNVSLWRELWSVYRWPVAVLILGKLPLTGLTVPGLFFLRGLCLSYGISAVSADAGTMRLLWSGLVYGPVCLLTIPVLFIVGVEVLLRKAGEPSQHRMLKTTLCISALLLCVFAEQSLIPKAAVYLITVSGK